MCAPVSSSGQRQVAWDCYLPSGPVNCVALRDAYYQETPGVVRSSEDRALGIEVRAIELPAAHRVSIRFRALDGEEAHFVERVRFTMDAQLAQLRLLAKLQHGTLPFLSLEGLVRSNEGELAVGTADALKSEDEDSKPTGSWYVRPEIGGDVLRRGMTTISAFAGLTVGYSTPAMRLLLDANGRYEYIDVELPGAGNISGGIFLASGVARLVNAIGSGFDLALLGEVRHEPNNNLGQRWRGGAGIEWLLQPLLDDGAGNVGVRYSLQVAHDRYLAENEQGAGDLTYFRHELEALSQLHTDLADLGLTISVGSPLHRHSFLDVRGQAMVSFQLGARAQLVCFFDVTYRGGALNAPSEDAVIDPVIALTVGSDTNRLSFGGNLSLAFNFGNALLHSRDQRWSL